MSDDFFEDTFGQFFEGEPDDESPDEMFDGLIPGDVEPESWSDDTSESGPRITLRCGPLELETEGRPDDTLAEVRAAHLDMAETTLASAFEMARTAWHRFWMDP